MYKISISFLRIRFSLIAVAAAALLTAVPGQVRADEESDAWTQFETAATLPTPPAEWQQSRPEESEIAAFKEKYAKAAFEAARKAEAFLKQFPDSPHAKEAKERRHELLAQAAGNGIEEAGVQLAEVEQKLLESDSLSKEERLQLLIQRAVRTAVGYRDQGNAKVFEVYEEEVRKLQKEFPDEQQIYMMLLEIASNTPPEKAKKIAKEITESAAPSQIKSQAEGLLKKLSVHGSELDLRFTALDGREISMEKLRGKVVLVDFWATWCGPCIQELPNVKAAYERLHEKGFEIVGISLDNERSQLERFVKREKMTWPQYFDGKGWQNDIAQEYGVTSIPAMWLVDQKGIVRDLNARNDLVAKVEAMLAE